MSEIFCPECHKEISSYAKSCPTCGFPMADFLKNHKLLDFNKVWICTKCGETYCDNYTKRPICEYCNTPLTQIDIDNAICFRNMCNMSTEDYANYQKNLALKYGNNFNQHFFYERRNRIYMDAERSRKEASDRIEKILTSNSVTNNQSTKPSNQPKCPTCGSTNIKKISAASKAGGMFMFGIFSKTAKSQFQCDDCGYKW